MKCYLTKDIRNVGIVGHGGTGKTQLVSSLLYAAGMTPRWGKVADGSATTDWDDEEVARKISIQAGLAYAEWPATPTGPSGSSDKVKINFIDLPGYSTFITETKDRKSTRLNSSHTVISYAVFCLKKKKKTK